MRFTSLSAHVSLFLRRFAFLFGGSLFFVGATKAFTNAPNIAISDLAMSAFGATVATLFNSNLFSKLLRRLSSPKGESILLSTSLIVCLSILVLKLIFGGSRFYENFLDENSVVEWLTALFLMLSAYFASLIYLSKGSPFPKKIFFALAIIFFIAGMEELSWGQMIFNWDSPEKFAALNSQSETNIHNLHGVSKLIDPALLLFSLTSAFLSLRKCKATSWSGFDCLRFSRGLFPMLFMAACFCTLTILFSGEVFLGRISQDIEWAEFLIAASILMQTIFLIFRSPDNAGH